MSPQQDVTVEQLMTDVQLELLPALVEGQDPDAYIVIPVGILSRQITLSAQAVAKRYRDDPVKYGRFAVHLMRSLQAVGVLVDTKYSDAGVGQ